MELFGVINTSPDSLAKDSIARSGPAALARAELLLADGATCFDLGGQGSTPTAAILTAEQEWSNLAAAIRSVVTLGKAVSVDTWRVSVAAKALEAGATVLNAADGLQSNGMIELAAAHECTVVLPFLPGPDPKHLSPVTGDPIDTMIDWFSMMLDRIRPFGLADRVLVDPGTGFGHANWAWEDRYRYQKTVYRGLDRLRSAFGLPLYVALPWKETSDRLELMEIALSHDIEYGRVHYPARVLAARRRVLARR